MIRNTLNSNLNKAFIIFSLIFAAAVFNGCGGSDGGGSPLGSLGYKDSMIAADAGSIKNITELAALQNIMVTEDNQDEYFLQLEKILNGDFINANLKSNDPSAVYFSGIVLNRVTDEVAAGTAYDLKSKIIATAHFSNNVSENITPFWTIYSGGGSFDGAVFSAPSNNDRTVFIASFVKNGTTKFAVFRLSTVTGVQASGVRSAASARVASLPYDCGSKDSHKKNDKDFRDCDSKNSCKKHDNDPHDCGSKNPCKKHDSFQLLLSKTSDEIFINSSTAVYDLSQITVTAFNPVGKEKDRTEYPHTTWALSSGLGVLNGKVYTAAVPETAVFTVSYAHAGTVLTAEFTLRIVGLSSIRLDKTSDEIILSTIKPNTYDLSNIAVSADYSNSTTKDVTGDPNTVWTIVSGAGTLDGKLYTATAAEKAFLRASYTEGGIIKTADFTLDILKISSIALVKNFDAIMLSPAGPNSYDFSGIGVTIFYSNGVSREVTDDENTMWSMVSGLGTLNGKVYAAKAIETASFKALYKGAEDSVAAGFDLKVDGLSSIVLNKSLDEIKLSLTGPGAYDLSKIAVTAHYTNSSSREVTEEPAAVWALTSGSGGLNGKIYTPPAASEKAVLTVSYTECGVTASAQFELTAVLDSMPPAVSLSDDHPDASVKSGDVIVITAQFTDNDKINEVPPPAISIGSSVVDAPMTKVSDFSWVYTWTVAAGIYGAQKVSINASDVTGNRNTPATGKTEYTIEQLIQKYEYVKQFSGLIYPCGVAVDSTGNVYATSQDHSIRRFDASGNPIKKWGSYGSGNGKFYNPAGIAIDPAGYVYVADEFNNRIQKFDSNGNFILKWGSYGSQSAQFYHQFDVAVDFAGYVYVADTLNHRVQKFDSNGNFIFMFGSFGTGDGQFNRVTAVKVDLSGNIYVTDANNNRIQKFDSNGNFILKWGTAGTGDGQFSYPSNIALDSAGNVYVSDHNNNRVQKFDSAGNFITQFGSSGAGSGQFNQPYGIAIDSAGNVYVSDCYNHRVQKFSPRY
ncbi:MAG TPA: 6-bladed beta-propeller [Candidatus Wallbacteria bacterium]|nr:MAG: Serine/threonine-protein kinase PknD [bacterium ADurb.Bin243]HPG56977.1 6-bladed beta-propeller [Candidatus Wallbacteria bacterium]